jgi:hypothetical protein
MKPKTLAAPVRGNKKSREDQLPTNDKMMDDGENHSRQQQTPHCVCGMDDLDFALAKAPGIDRSIYL